MLFIRMILAIQLAVFAANSVDAAQSYLNAARSNLPTTVQPSPSTLSRRANTPQSNVNRGGQTRDRGGCSQNYKFDYLMLTLQWGPGVCSTSDRKCIKSNNRLFTIHGMWPQLNSGEEKGFCCFDNTFDPRSIQSLESDLNRYWFSYYSSNNKGFWSHEWLKHGTCARDVKQLEGEQLFFSKTLDIVKSLPILDTLKKDSILPGDSGVPYAVGDIMKSLRKITGGKAVKINCDLEHDQRVPVLTGLGVCFDRNLSYIDCPYQSKRCQGQVLFRDTARSYN